MGLYGNLAKNCSPKIERCVTVVIVDMMQIELSFQKKLDDLL